MAEIIDFPKRHADVTVDDVIDALQRAKPHIESLSIVLTVDGQTHSLFFNAGAGEIAFAALTLQRDALFAGWLLVDPDSPGVV